jgi:autotransporter-associated beta strand protein
MKPRNSLVPDWLGSGSALLIPAAALAVLISLPAASAFGQGFSLTSDGVHRVTAFDLTSGGGATDTQVSSATEALGIWNAIDAGGVVPGAITANSQTYNVGAYVNNTVASIDYVGGGDFSVNRALSTIGTGFPMAGAVEDVSVRARTYLAVPVGNWSIAIASDDGRRLAMSDAQAGAAGSGGVTGFSTFSGHGGQMDSGSGTGQNFLLYAGTTGHERSIGTFSVTPAQVESGTNVALLYLDGFYFERGTGGGSVELSIRNGLDTTFGGASEGWTLLQNGTFGWTVSSTPMSVNFATSLGDRTWHDASTGDWTATNWDTGAPPASGTNSGDYPTLSLSPLQGHNAYVPAGTVNVSGSQGAMNLTVSDSGAVNVPSGSTLTVRGVASTIAGGAIGVGGSLNAYTLSDSGGIINLANGGSLTADNGSAGALNVSGMASFAVTGNSSLIINNVNLATGATLNASGSWIANNATAGTFNQTNGTARLSNVGGSGGLTVTGNGKIVLATANTYPGATTIGPGTTVEMGNNASLGAEAAKTTIQSGGTLDIKGFRAGVNGNELVEVSGTGVGGNGAIINTGASQTSAFRQITLTGNATFRADSRWDMRNTGGASVFDMGGYTLTKVGASELPLVSTDILNEGSVNVNQGIFRLEGSTRYEGSGTITVASGATLDFYLNSQTHSPNITLQNASNLTAQGGGGPTFSGNVTLSGTPNIVTSNDITLTGQVTGSGFAKQGAARLILRNAANNFTGAVTVGAGALRLESSNALGTTAGGTSIVGGASLELQGGISVPAESLSLGSVTSTGEKIVNLGGANSFAGNLALGPATATTARSAATIDTQSGSLTLGGAIDMNLSNLTVTGAGDTVIQGAISGANTATSVYLPGLLGGSRQGNPSTGTANPGNFGITPGPNGMLRDGGPRDAQREAHWGAPRGAGGGTGPGDTTLIYSGEVYLSGPTTFIEQNDDTTILTVNGVQVINNGSWNNAVRGTYTPPTPGWYSFDVRFANGGGGYGFSGQQDTAQGDSNWSDATVQLGFRYKPGTIATDNALDYDPAEDPGDGTLFRVLRYASPNDLIKSGSGTLTLNGNNSYAGTTSVQQGTLLVNGVTSGQGNYTVASGATLGGSGTVGLASGGSVTLETGATLSPGTSGPGTFSVVGDLTMQSGTTYLWELSPTAHDQVDLTGMLQLDDWTLALVDAGGEVRAGDKLYLFTGFTDLEMLGSVSFDLARAPAWLEFTDPGALRIGQDSGGLYLTGLQTVPEPSALALAALALVAMLTMRRTVAKR